MQIQVCVSGAIPPRILSGNLVHCLFVYGLFLCPHEPHPQAGAVSLLLSFSAFPLSRCSALKVSCLRFLR